VRDAWDDRNRSMCTSVIFITGRDSRLTDRSPILFGLALHRRCRRLPRQTGGPISHRFHRGDLVTEKNALLELLLRNPSRWSTRAVGAMAAAKPQARGRGSIRTLHRTPLSPRNEVLRGRSRQLAAAMSPRPCISPRHCPQAAPELFEIGNPADQLRTPGGVVGEFARENFLNRRSTR
jgi:hypothetical protein